MTTPLVSQEINPTPGEVSPGRVSVCMPTCNGEEFIAEAIQSVLAQSFQDFELLVVDDRSTDATLEVVRAFVDPRIQVYPHDERLGIPGNWNRCLSLARGEYLCLFHQDDVMLPENLARKIQVLASDPTVGVVHSAVEVVVEDVAPTMPADWREHTAEDFLVEGAHYFRQLLLQGNLICAPMVVARRQQLLELGGFDEELGFACDYEMWMKVCVDSRVAFLSQPLIRYRWHGKNASHVYRFERGVEERLLASRKAVQYYLERTGRQEEGAILQEAVIALTRLRRWTAELERGKGWVEAQRASWQQMAEERERIIAERKARIEELERDKAWLEEQWQYWQAKAEQRTATITELEGRIAELERYKAWVEEQQRYWQAKAMQLQESLWVRLGLRLGTLQSFSLSLQERSKRG